MDYEQELPDPHPDFIKGFNEGYILSSYAPELSSLFGAYAPESERGKGFRKGKEQYAYEDKNPPTRESMKDHRDNQKDMGIKDTPEKKMQDFRQAKSEHGLAKQKYPDWLQDTNENKADLDLDKEPDRDKGDVEPEVE